MGSAVMPTFDNGETGLSVRTKINNAIDRVDGLQTTSSPAFAGLTVNGNITITGTVDGRDVSTDGAKLDSIEAGATADLTAAEVKTLYESNANTNAFTDAEQALVAGALQASNNLSDLTIPATALTNLGLTATATEINYTDGVTSAIQAQLDGKQPLDAGLTSIAGLTTAADRMIYTTASDTYDVTTLTAAGRAILDDASAADQVATLGLSSVGKNYDTRADFVADTYTPADGVVVHAGGLTYVRDAAATTIPDLSGWLPFGEMEPGHFATFAAYLTATDYSLSTRFEGDINVATFENTKGITFEGNGRIFTPVTGGSWQRNSYSPLRTLHMGHEYIEAPYTYMALGQGSSGTFQVRIFGDSTATDDYGGALPSNVIRRAFQERGIPNFELFNEAVAGTAWDDCNAVASLTSNTALIFLKYGVNDPANGVDLESRLAALYTNMDTVLSGIRADADGDLASLAIILVGPNSTSDTPNNRDEQWYEKVRGIYVAMARKHHCAYFDTYGQFLDSRPAANIYMDDPYADGRAIHPTNQFNARIWGKIMDEFFSRGQIALYATNLFTNEGDISGTVTAATLPSVYNFGTFINRATTGDGWPQDGFVITTKNPDGGVMQEVWNFGSTTRVTKRTANTGSDTWNNWSGVGVALTLSNSWVVQGAPWQSPIATKTADGTVVVEGLVNSGTTTAGTVIATLPAGYRPTADSLFVVAANGGFVTLSVEAGGSIKAFTAADGTFTSLSGICFSAA